ncbi:MAG: hypothetical protein II868_09045 [Butyrivibrio sp.]|nr:hypothetical protein [Butyrivibrio sp.]
MKKSLQFIICILLISATCTVLDFALYPCTYMRNDVHTVTTAQRDVLFLGTSNGKMNIDPDAVLAGTELTGHNLCNGNQYPLDSYHLLKLVIEKQKPAYVIFDVDPAVFVTEKTRGNNYLLFYHEFPFSRAKLSYFADAVADCDLRAMLFPFYEYPLKTELSRMKDTVYQKATRNYDVSYLKGVTGEYHENGFMERYPVAQEAFPAMSARTFSEEALVEENIHYLERIISLCRENNITFLAASLPQSEVTLQTFPEAFDSAWAYFDAFFASHGVDYYNFNTDHYDAFPHDASHYVDYNGHMNGESARAFSKALGNVLGVR